MRWTTVATHVDPENGVKIEKQRKKRNGRGSETRYLVQINQERFVYINRKQIFDVTDTLNDLCDLLEEGKF